MDLSTAALAARLHDSELDDSDVVTDHPEPPFAPLPARRAVA